MEREGARKPTVPTLVSFFFFLLFFMIIIIVIIFIFMWMKRKKGKLPRPHKDRVGGRQGKKERITRGYGIRANNKAKEA